MSSSLDMLIGGGSNGPGNNALWSGGIAPVKSVTDQSDHVTGGNLKGGSGTNATAGAPAKQIMYMSAAIVLGAIALLWLSGTIVIRGASL